MRPIIMKPSLAILRRFYFWTDSMEESPRPGYLRILSASYLLIGCFLHLTITKHHPDTVESVQMLISQFAVLYFDLFWVLNRKEIIELVGQISDFEKFGKPPHFEDRCKKIDRFSFIYNITLLLSICGIFGFPGILTRHCNVLNRRKNRDKICGLVAQMWLPFDYRNFPVKQIVYAYQCYCCFILYMGAGVISVVIMESMEHLITRIQHLKMLITLLMEETDDRIRHQMLGKCVEYHLEIFDVGKKINSSFQVSLSIHVLCAGIVFGCIGQSILEVSTAINSFSLFYGWFSALTIVCLGGQHLLDECISVGETIYGTKWYDLDVKFQKNVIPIIIRSQRPILVYAGPFTYVSHVLALGVLRTGYSYVQLLRATS